MVMVYGIDILKVTPINTQMDPAVSISLEPMVQLKFFTYFSHAVLKAFFSSSCDFPSLDIIRIVASTSIMTYPFELSP